MRLPVLATILLVTTATTASAQRTEPLDRRIERIEKELRAVQRKVFPGGTPVEPEYVPQQSIPGPAGVPASSAVADLSSRLDAIESQLSNLTGQVEENAHRLRQLEQSLSQFKGEVENRFTAAAPPVQLPAGDIPAIAAPPAADTSAGATDAGEAAYLAGYRLWEAGQFDQAQAALEDVVKKYPKHARASFARNLLGRAYLDGGKPATAAKVFLTNYQTNPKGDRAADSLYFLGQSLVQLGKRTEACKVYDELQDVYGASLRDWVKQRLPAARKDARCA